MILLFGIPTEPPLELVRQALDGIGARYLMFNQRHVQQAHLDYGISAGAAEGTLRVNGSAYRLSDFSAIYARPMDFRFLPELRQVPPESPIYRHSQLFHQKLMTWTDLAPGRVVNRPAPMCSNFSKPYQAQLIRAQGFDVPATLVTNDPEAVLEFRRAHGQIIYKSVSGARSIVRTFTDDDLDRLNSIIWCPTQFQERLVGFDVRVHTIGAEAFAAKIVSDGTDYRYTTRFGGHAELEPYHLSDELADRCISLSRALGLEFSGIDLMVTPEGRTVCFEVNPSPAYSYYEESTGLPISTALARFLDAKDAKH